LIIGKDIQLKKVEYIYPTIPNLNKNELRITKTGEYSITPAFYSFKLPQLISKYIRSCNLDVSSVNIFDATGNNGGDTIRFALNYPMVVTTEIDELNHKVLKHNVDIYASLSNKFGSTVILNQDFLKSFDLIDEYKINVLYIDAPWGGPYYYKQRKLDLFLSSDGRDINIRDIIKTIISRAYNSLKLIVLKVPFNYNFESLKEYKHNVHDIRKNDDKILFYFVIVRTCG